MRIQRIWITSLVLVALNLLSQRNSITLALDQEVEQIHRTSQRDDGEIRDDDIPGVVPLTSENNSLNTNNDVIIKSQIPSKGIDIKSNENKKKSLGFGSNTSTPIKFKNETKYQNPKDGKITEKITMNSENYTTESSTMFLPTIQNILNIHSESNRTIDSTFPFLFHGVPIGNNTVLQTNKIMDAIGMNTTNLMRGRALNVSTPDLTNSLYANITDLSDVSMDENDKEIEGGEYIAIHNETNTTIFPLTMANTSMCTEGNKSYAIGENIVRGCDEKCICGENGKIKNCEPLCITPYVRAGRANRDSLCHEQKVDNEGCCAVLICTDSAPEPEETCLFGNKTLIRGQRIEDGCTKICDCETGGALKCTPRCPPNDTNSAMNHHDRCVALADPRDPCCTITYCDVSLGEDEIKSENASDLSVNLTDIKILNSTAIKLKLSSELTNETFVEVSENNHLWRQQTPERGGIITKLEPAHSYYVRIREGGRTGPALRVIMPAEVIKTNVTEKMDKNSCNHRGKLYKIGAEWYDDCLSICMCGEGAKTECITIECPTDFGLDVLDPHCVDWETVPPNFIPKAPNCCPQEVRCRNNGSCSYENKTYDNWSEIPSDITGCEKRCYCEMGKVTCQGTCPPIPALPPSTLKCQANEAILANLPNDDCCSHWVCNHNASSTSGNTKKKTTSIDSLLDNVKSKPGHSNSGKLKPDGKKPGQEILPDELLHLINLHHPGLTQLDNSPAPDHPGLYEFHQQVINQPEPPANQIPLGYFGRPIQPSKKGTPQIIAHKNENGETTYHVHTSDIPNSPQQIEELLAHISQHDSNNGPFQRYPDRPPISHNYPGGLPVSPPRIDFHAPNSGVPHLNHPLTVQTSIQSGMPDHNFHGGFPINGAIPEYTGQASGQSSSNEIIIKALDPLDDRTVRVIFTVSSVLVGLHGRVELRYTSDKSNIDPSTWRSQVFIPPNDLIATSQLEFNLDGLEPATEYNVKVTVNLRDLANSPTSKIYTVRTLPKYEEQTTLPPQIPIDAELNIVETNSSWVKVMWKKFTEYEMQFIDGVQLRYKERDGKVYAATPLIHRAVTSYVIENLKSATTYEIGISIIPFPGQTTELISEKTVQLTTAVEPDPYSFDVKIEIKTVKSQDVEISWTGVPYPQDKYVNIYRAIYQSDNGKGDSSTFKIAKRDSTAKTVINDLKPGTRYRLWLEIYLTNGRIKKSNVQDFITKPGVILPAGISQQGKLASIPLHEGDYYGPLVIVAIVASLAILSTLILLMILMKRRSSSKAEISPRKTTSAYDNPSYKTCEDAVTITNGRNKITEHEMSAINSNIDAKENA